MELSTDPSTADVVSRIGGVTDTISDVEAIWPSENLCIAKFADAEFGVLSPATRQSAARWLRRAGRQEYAGLVPYLQQAAEYSNNSGPEIIMAIDLDQIVRPDAIRAAVEGTDFLQALNVDEVTRVLTSLRGVTLGVRVTERIYGKLIFDFGADASLLEPVAQKTRAVRISGNRRDARRI